MVEFNSLKDRTFKTRRRDNGGMKVWVVFIEQKETKKITQTTSTTFYRGLHKLMCSKTVRIGLKQAK